jgi:ferric-dicitrate binding protein FerR (iron transport regulator)
MPLSEDEQRILRQIEEQHQRDPSFGRDLHHRRGSSRRSIVLTSLAAVFCLAACVALLSVSPYLSFVAFIAAVVAVVFAERHARTLGEAGLNHLSESVRSRLGGASGARNTRGPDER